MAGGIEQFVERLVASGLMSGAEVQSFQGKLAPDQSPPDAQSLARALVLAGRLTKYQATAVYQGKTKGLVFGEYIVLDKIGQGGMGVVLKAQHRRLKRQVAIKILPAATMKSPEAVRRFYREVEAAGFKLVAEADFLRNPDDPRDTRVFQPAIPVDEFVLKYRKPE